MLRDIPSKRKEYIIAKKGVLRLFRINKTVLQLVLLVVGVAMLSFGALRGEADTVLAKAIRLCLECVGIG